MRTIFVSSYNVDKPPASSLIAALRNSGVVVENSPSNPADKSDPKWKKWYDEGLMATLMNCDTFVAVITDVWDSTWMVSECQTALNLHNVSMMKKYYYWNPQRISVTAAGLVPYLKSELPMEMDKAVDILIQSNTA